MDITIKLMIKKKKNYQTNGSIQTNRNAYHWYWPMPNSNWFISPIVGHVFFLELHIKTPRISWISCRFFISHNSAFVNNNNNNNTIKTKWTNFYFATIFPQLNTQTDSQLK